MVKASVKSVKICENFQQLIYSLIIIASQSAGISRKALKGFIISAINCMQRFIDFFCRFCCCSLAALRMQLAMLIVTCFWFRTGPSKMPSLPQGAFAAHKIREQSKSSNGNESKSRESDKFFFLNQRFMEYSPVKYNEKFMNAIWGHYNRYSPHNIKSNDSASADTTKNLLPAAIQPQHN